MMRKKKLYGNETKEGVLQGYPDILYKLLLFNSAQSYDTA